MRTALLLTLALLATRPGAAATDPFPKAAASYLVAVDGEVLWERDADARRAPASLTKMMTALVALDGDWRPDGMVTVSRTAAAATGARLGLKAGEKMRAGDLLAAMLVRSANDACIALAEHEAGTVAAFVPKMNARAAALGLRATHFVDPCGFDHPEQRSSARDLWRLAEAALAHPTFADLVARERVRVRTAGGRRFDLPSSNALLGRLPGAAGVKTGYTRGAGKCVVALVVRDGVRVLAVLLDAEDRWWAVAAMVEKAYEASAMRRAISSGETSSLWVAIPQRWP